MARQAARGDRGFTPRTSAAWSVAIGTMNGGFGAMLDKAFERSRRAREVKQIEASAVDLAPACVSMSEKTEPSEYQCLIDQE
jgi:hypothetical protein